MGVKVLKSTPSQDGGGITIYGDPIDLDGLYDAISYFSEGPPLTTSQQEYILVLANDVRHASQGDRESFCLSLYEKELTYYGFHVLWPVFFLQLVLLRTSAIYHPTPIEHEATLTRLLACTENALVGFDSAVGAKCFEYLYTFPELNKNYILDFVGYCSHHFICRGKPGKTRFKRLPKILAMLDPTSIEYEEYIEQWERASNTNDDKQWELIHKLNWPDFK
jgi:hypothetical protein